MTTEYLKSVKIRIADLANQMLNRETSPPLNDINALQNALLVLRALVGEGETAFPQEFLCPISARVMDNPIYVRTVKAIDEITFQEWVKDAFINRGKSEEFIRSLYSIDYDNVLKHSISTWCHDELQALLELLSSSSLTKKKAASRRIRLLLSQSSHARQIFGRDDLNGALILLSVLDDKVLVRENPSVREDLLMIMLYISDEERCRIFFLTSAIAPDILLYFLTIGTIESRGMVASILSNLAVDDAKIESFGMIGSFAGLLNFIKDGSSPETTDAAKAVWKLCYYCQTNRTYAIQEGAVSMITEILFEKVKSEEEELNSILVSSLLLLVTDDIGGDQAADILLGSLTEEGLSLPKKEFCVRVLRMACEKSCNLIQKIKGNDVVLKIVSEIAERNSEAVEIIQLTQGRLHLGLAAFDILSSFDVYLLTCTVCI